MDSNLQVFLNTNQPNALAVAGDFPIDESVVKVFPAGTKVLSANRFGTSAWTITAKLVVELPDGTQEPYFIKCAAETVGKQLMEGEFNAMTELFKNAPKLVPEPIAWGKYQLETPATYFYLQRFIDMSDRVPDPVKLCSKLAQLHRDSVSPNGKFGFHVNTCQGKTQQSVGWEDSWTVFFGKMLQFMTQKDFETNGYWKELDALEQRVFSHVIPTLVGNLERDGRKVKPCLIHADLWEGNTGTSYETGDVYIFDAAAYYAHNEMEIGDWRCHYNKIHNKIYTRTYLRYYGPSEPKEEWDDRNRLYSIYYNMIYSVNHMDGGRAVRQVAYDDMYFLIDKYAPFGDGEGPPRLQESDRLQLSAEKDHTMS